MPPSSVVQILTGSIAPVIVISGIGLLLLSISNRYGRVLDRARALLKELEHGEPEDVRAVRLEEQLEHTYQRARLLRSSMMYASASIFFVSLTVLTVFAEYVLMAHRDYLAIPFFALCLICLVISMYYSLRDITQSLGALELEIESVKGRLGNLQP